MGAEPAYRIVMGCVYIPAKESQATSKTTFLGNLPANNLGGTRKYTTIKSKPQPGTHPPAATGLIFPTSNVS